MVELSELLSSRAEIRVYLCVFYLQNGFRRLLREGKRTEFVNNVKHQSNKSV